MTKCKIIPLESPKILATHWRKTNISKESVKMGRTENSENLMENVEAEIHQIYLKNKNYNIAKKFPDKLRKEIRPLQLFAKLCNDENCDQCSIWHFRKMPGYDYYFPRDYYSYYFCAECLCEKHKINYRSMDKNFFYYIPSLDLLKQPDFSNICLSKDDDFPKLRQWFLPIRYEFNSPDGSGIYSSGSRMVEPNDEELSAFIQIHREFLKNSGRLKSISFPLFPPLSYKIVVYQLAKNLFCRFKIPRILATEPTYNEQIQTCITEFDKFIRQMFNLTFDDTPDLVARYTTTLHACSTQLDYLPPSNPPFAKLCNVFYDISDGNPLIIKKFAVLLTKIFIGKNNLKKLYPDSVMQNLTCIVSDNPAYIKNFLVDIFEYTPNPKNIDYSKRELRVSSVHRMLRPENFYLCTTHPCSYVCNSKNIKDLIKEKLLGNIVNIDANTTPFIETFSKFVSGVAVTGSDNDGTINSILTYRSNSYYIKIVQSVNDLFKNSAEIAHDTIVCEGNTYETAYNRLDAYELFFLVTGFLAYGINLIEEKLTEEPSPSVLSAQEECIADFFNEFYIQTFDPEKANHSQKDDSNDFVDANDMYLNYKKWFTIVNREFSACSISKFRNHLKTAYGERLTGKELAKLNKSDQKKQLKNRYLKNNETDHRGISGLKFNESKFKKFLEDSSQGLDDEVARKQAFEKFFFSEVLSFCPYPTEA
ncbi:MAG: hypothetical protein ABFC84_08500 [Veillonellales bacterium]